MRSAHGDTGDLDTRNDDGAEAEEEQRADCAAAFAELNPATGQLEMVGTCARCGYDRAHHLATNWRDCRLTQATRLQEAAAAVRRESDAVLADEPVDVRDAAFALLVVAAAQAPGEPCPACGQRPGMQTGEYPCSQCGEPMLHDEPVLEGVISEHDDAPEPTLRRALLLACERIADGPQEYHEANTPEGWAAHYIRQAQEATR